LRISIGFVVVASAFAGSLGSASAQYAPPPPYGAPQPVYRDASGYPYAPGTVQPNRDDVDAPIPAGRPYFAPQPMPMVDGSGSYERPPASVAASGDPADVTGSVRAPVTSAPMSAPMSSPMASPMSRPTVVAALPPDEQPDQGPAKELPPQFRRQVVDLATPEPPGTIIIDTPNTYLYLVTGGGKAMRYGIGVGREGFTWSGTERISRMKEWPDWFPPKEMIERQPYLPRFMAGGDTNPLGARAMYLGSTLYRIHGTNQPSTIGTYVSSGCIRLTNDDVADLYSRVNVGTRVVVMPGAQNAASAQMSPRAPITR
jgi:lipoprotein-anchoring transpeptidase ErfK/SrfK